MTYTNQFFAVLCIFIVCNSQANATPSNAASEILQRVKNSTVQVQIIDTKSNTVFAYGTGFAADGDGRYLTNYHVVSKYVFEPKKYRLQYENPDGVKGELSLLAIDIANDLAVLGSDLRQRPLALSQAPINKGEHVFSIGYPLYQGITVIEGTFNGRSEESFRERFHITTPLNAGMSGGPALTQNGEVFGVNVATRYGAQLISLMVPAKFASQILEKSRSSTKTDSHSTEALSQITEQSNVVIDQLLAKPWERQTIGKYTLPGKQGDRMKCFGNSVRLHERKLDKESFNCSSQSYFYVSDNIHVGHIDFSFILYRDLGLGIWHFYKEMENIFPTFEMLHDNNNKTRFSCSDRIINLNGFVAKTALCLSGYRKLEKIYDYSLHAITLQSANEALYISIKLSGVSEEAALRYLKHFMENIQWKNDTTLK